MSSEDDKNVNKKRGVEYSLDFEDTLLTELKRKEEELEKEITEKNRLGQREIEKEIKELKRTLKNQTSSLHIDFPACYRDKENKIDLSDSGDSDSVNQK